MTGFIKLVDSAITQRLTTTAGTSFYGTRVYYAQAPEGTTLPYIVFDYSSGGSDQLTPNPTADFEYRIECVAATKSDSTTGVGHIETAFPVNYALDIVGYKAYSLQEQRFFSRIDNIGGTQYWRRGAFFRLRYDGTV